MEENTFFGNSSPIDVMNQSIYGDKTDTDKQEGSNPNEDKKDDELGGNEEVLPDDGIQSAEEVDDENAGKAENDEPILPDNTWLEKIKEYGFDVESEEDFKIKLYEYKNAKNELDNSKTKIQEIESREKELNDKLEALLNSGDPNKVFANETIKRLNDIAKAYPDKDQGQIIRALSSDLSTMNPEEILALDFLINNPSYKGSESDVIEDFKGRYSDIQLGMEAAYASTRLRGITENIKESEGIDVEKMLSDFNSQKELRVQESQKAWNPIKEELLKQNEINFSGFSYNIDEADMKLTSDMVDRLSSLGISPSKENVELIKDLARGISINKNIDKMMAKRDAIMESKIKEKLYKELNNEKPPNKGKRGDANRDAYNDKQANARLENQFLH